jgi:hypothetical protein
LAPDFIQKPQRIAANEQGILKQLLEKAQFEPGNTMTSERAPFSQDHFQSSTTL